MNHIYFIWCILANTHRAQYLFLCIPIIHISCFIWDILFVGFWFMYYFFALLSFSTFQVATDFYPNSSDQLFFGVNMYLDPCSKVIGFWFCNVTKWYLNSKYRLAILWVALWCVWVYAGKISLYFVRAIGIGSCLKSAKLEECDVKFTDTLRYRRISGM